MNEAGHGHAAAAATTSGCGCAVKATTGPANDGCCGGQGDQGHHHHHHHDQAAAAGAVKDPVCGMNVDPATSKHRFAHQAKTFHFCSARCREKFAAEPAKYLEQREPPQDAAPGAIYTCPMHPEIRQVGPGSCPICGMALEPEVASLDLSLIHI